MTKPKVLQLGEIVLFVLKDTRVISHSTDASPTGLTTSGSN
jgi:hypothetical protein